MTCWIPIRATGARKNKRGERSKSVFEEKNATQPKKNEYTSMKLKIKPETVDIGVTSNCQCVGTLISRKN